MLLYTLDCLPPSHPHPLALGMRWLRLPDSRAGKNGVASSFINSQGAPFINSIHVPMVPSKSVFQVPVPKQLSLSGSPISMLSCRLQFDPHVEVVTTLSVGSSCSSYINYQNN